MMCVQFVVLVLYKQYFNRVGHVLLATNIAVVKLIVFPCDLIVCSEILC